MPQFTVKQRRAAVTVAVTAAVYLAFKYILPLFLPFLAAYLIALLLRPSAVFLEKRLRFHVGKRRFGIPVGVIGGIEILILTAVLGTAFYYGGRRLFLEANEFVNAIPRWIQELDDWLTGMCHSLELFCRLREGILVKMMREVLLGAVHSFKSAAMPNLVVNSVGVCLFFAKVGIVAVILFIASVLSLQEMEDLQRRRRRSIFHREFALLGARLTMTGSAWLRTQAVILVLTSCLCTLAFLLIHNSYPILAGIGVGLLDALPIFGTGSVLIPWGVILLIRKKWFEGLVLLGVYLACYFLREFVEAKLMGKEMGLSPLETLASIYVGLELFGFLGFILGPVGLLIIEDLVEEYDSKRGEKEVN